MIKHFPVFKTVSFFLFIAFFATMPKGFSQEIKGLYVDDFKAILGHPLAEKELLSYAEKQGFNYLILYNTSHIHRFKYPLNAPNGSAVWQAFIRLAKTQYGIQKIGIVGEKANSFLPAIQYNEALTDSLARIDVFNLEFEFWNKKLTAPGGYYCTSYLQKQGYSCNTDGAFLFYLKQLKAMKELTANSPVETETYIGNPSNQQLIAMAPWIDRLLVHYYRNKTENLARYKLNRLEALQQANANLQVVPIFSSRENHSGPWLESHNENELPTLFYSQLKSIKEIKTDKLKIKGYVWYRYSDMPK